MAVQEPNVCFARRATCHASGDHVTQLPLYSSHLDCFARQAMEVLRTSGSDRGKHQVAAAKRPSTEPAFESGARSTSCLVALLILLDSVAGPTNQPYSFATNLEEAWVVQVWAWELCEHRLARPWPNSIVPVDQQVAALCRASDRELEEVAAV